MSPTVAGLVAWVFLAAMVAAYALGYCEALRRERVERARQMAVALRGQSQSSGSRLQDVLDQMRAERASQGGVDD